MQWLRFWTQQWNCLCPSAPFSSTSRSQWNSLCLSLSLSVWLSLSFSLSLLCFVVCVYHGFTVSRTNTIMHSTRRGARGASKGPCSDRSNKNGCSNIKVYPEWCDYMYTNIRKQCLVFTQTLTCEFLIKSDQIHLPLRKAIRMFLCVWAEIQTFEWLS